MTWDGNERRSGEVEKGNLLIEIHTDLRHLVKNFDNHLRDDKEKFADIDKKIDFQQKILYGCMGAFVFVEFVMKIVK